MPFRPSFDCLWCGAAHVVRDRAEVEGWAQLCPACVGRAGENGFLRFRLRQALIDRGSAAREAVSQAGPDSGQTGPAPGPLAASTLRQGDPIGAIDAHGGDHLAPGPGADAPGARGDPGVTVDDLYLRRGRHARGPIHDAAWNAELDAAGRWLDRLPIRGEIVELAASSGWWSTLLAGKGTLSAYDASPALLDLARDRLVAHRLRAHLHVRDPWAEPDREVDALFSGLWLGRVPADQLPAFLRLARRWLKPGGTFAFIDLLPDPLAETVDDVPTTIVENPAAMRQALVGAGFAAAEVRATGRFFVLGHATA